MSLSNRDYEKLAKAIVSDYQGCGQPLRDSIIKVADDHDLNVHETQRLIEQTNLKTHLTLFKEASDKYVEFDVVEPDDVIGELFGRVPPTQGDAGPGEKVASEVLVDHHFDLPDERRQETWGAIEKTASEAPDVEEPDTRPYAGDRGYHVYARLNKIASEFQNTIREKHIEYEDAIEKLAQEFRSIYGPDLKAFEKDAYALYGEDAGNAVFKLHEALNKTPSMAPTKLASHFVHEEGVHEKLAQAIEIHQDLVDHIEGYQAFIKKAGPLVHD